MCFLNGRANIIISYLYGQFFVHHFCNKSEIHNIWISIEVAHCPRCPLSLIGYAYNDDDNLVMMMMMMMMMMMVMMTLMVMTIRV